MHPLSILLLGLAMSTDAFAAALGKGAAMGKPGIGQALRVGLVFGTIEGVTPVVGWLLGKGAAGYVQAWDHWIAFGLLLALGLHMIWNSTTPHGDKEERGHRPQGLAGLALTGLSTSIDAAAVGASLAFVDAPIAIIAVVIGLCTLVMATLGTMLGHALGTLVGQRAEFAGGLVLIAVGAAILYEHLHA